MKGVRQAVALLREGVEMLDGIERLIQKERIECSFVRCGRFRGAMRPAHYEAMARDMEDLRRYAGVEFALVPRGEQHREIETDVFHGGSLLLKDANLHPGRYHAGLVLTGSRGGVIRAVIAVRGIRPTAGDERSHSMVSIFESAMSESRRMVTRGTSGLFFESGSSPFLPRRLLPHQFRLRCSKS